VIADCGNTEEVKGGSSCLWRFMNEIKEKSHLQCRVLYSALEMTHITVMAWRSINGLGYYYYYYYYYYGIIMDDLYSQPNSKNLKVTH
jgi:hypothetical protein